MRMNIFSGELYHGESRLGQRPDIHARIQLPKGVTRNDEQLWTNLFWIVRWELEQFAEESPSYYSPLWNAVASNDWDNDSADKLIDRAVLIANFDNVSDDPRELCDKVAVPAIKMAQGALWASNERCAQDSGMPRNLFDEALDWAQNEKEFLNEVRSASRTNHSGGGQQGGWGNNKSQGDSRLSTGRNRGGSQGSQVSSGGWGSPVQRQEPQQEQRNSPYQHRAPQRTNRPATNGNQTGSRRSFVTASSSNPLEENVPTTEHNTGAKTPMRTQVTPANPNLISNRIVHQTLFGDVIGLLSGSEELPSASIVEEAPQGETLDGNVVLNVSIPAGKTKLVGAVGPLTMGALAVKQGLGQRVITVTGYGDGETLIIKEDISQEVRDVDYASHLLGQRRPATGSKKHHVNYAYYTEEAVEGEEGLLLTEVEGEVVSTSDFLIASGTCCEAVPAAVNAQRRSTEDGKAYAHEYHMTLIRPMVVDDADDAAMSLMVQARDIEKFTEAYNQLSRPLQIEVEQRCMKMANKLLIGSMCIEAELETFDELGDVVDAISDRPDWGGKQVAGYWTSQIPKILAYASRTASNEQEEDVRSVYSKWDALDGQDLNLVHTFAKNVSTLVVPNLLGEFEIDCSDEDRMVLAKWSHPEMYNMVHSFVRRLRDVEVDVIRLVLADVTYEVLPVLAVSGAYTLTKM